jgi:hypothetical protein
MSRFIRMVLLGGLCVLLSAAAATAAIKKAQVSTVAARAAVLKQGIEFYRESTWRWQDTALRPRTSAAYDEKRTKGLAYLRWIARLWVQRAADARRFAENPPHKTQWLCIHRGEAAWDNPGVDWRGNPSRYHGGLSMDWEFQHSYAPRRLLRRGQAENWTPLEQMWVAEKAFRSGRGFWPWPNTAAACGLL